MWQKLVQIYYEGGMMKLQTIRPPRSLLLGRNEKEMNRMTFVRTFEDRKPNRPHATSLPHPNARR